MKEYHETPKLIKRVILSIVFLCPLLYISVGHKLFGWPMPALLRGNYVGMGVCAMLLSGMILIINQDIFFDGRKGLPLTAMGSGVSFFAGLWILLVMTSVQTAGDADTVASYNGRLYFEAAAMTVILVTLSRAMVLSAGSSVAAKNGIRFLTDVILETAGECSVAVLDNIRIITEGNPKVTDVIPNETVSVQRLLSAAGMLESQSSHPLAAAILEHITINNESYPVADKALVLSGMDVRATYSGRKFYGGRQAYIFEKLQGTEGEEDFVSFVRSWKPERYEKKGKTAFFFACDDKLLGAIMVKDTLREDAAPAVRALKALGMRVIMLTGDNDRTATAIGRASEVEAVIAQVMPRNKENVIRRLQGRIGKVMMVGDGIEDVPVLTAAYAGFVIGTDEDDIAMGASDVVLAGKGLLDVSRAMILSRGIKRSLRQNLFFTFFFNIAAVLMAAGVYPEAFTAFKPAYPVMAMGLAWLFVVPNALRLNLIRLDRPARYKRKRSSVSIRKVLFREVVKGGKDNAEEHADRRNDV